MQFARPLLLDPITGQLATAVSEEVQYRLQDGVDLYDGGAKVRRGDVLTITSHRLYLVDTARLSPIQWNLSQVVNIASEEGGFIVGSPKIVLTLRALLTAKAGTPSPQETAIVKLSFKSGGRDQCLESLRKAYERRSWEISMPAAGSSSQAAGGPPAEKRPRLEPTAVMAAPGIGGIMKRQEMEQRADASLAQEAFADLGELERHAKAIVQLAETYAGEVGKRKAAAQATSAGAGAGSSDSSSSSSTAGSDDVNSELGALVTTLGIVNPVTRAAAGNLYNSEVARQLAGFIRPILERSGGMLALTDVYCLYNRARVTDLVSPEDVLQAAQQVMGTDPNKCPLGVYLREFPSGLKVLQHSAYSDAETARRITALLNEMAAAAAATTTTTTTTAIRRPLANEPFVSALSLSTKWKVPLQVATQQLLLAEASGALCRDDGLNGLRFFRNKFL